MKSVYNLFFLASLLAGNYAQGQVKKPAAGKKPNIIFILTDDLGYGDIGIFYQKIREKNADRAEPWMFTPNLDELAANGAQLTQHYCAAPVCAPSRASIMLGVNQGHANVRDNQFDKALENNHTLATVLSKAGYSTAAIGKWGLQGDKRWDKDGDKWPAHPLNRGFEYYFGYMRHGDGHEHYPKEGLYDGAKEVYENRTNIAAQLDKCYTGDLWTAAAKKWIISHAGGKDSAKPFFMYLAYDTPHAVIELPTQAYPAGGGLKGGVQWLGTPGHMINTALGKIDSWYQPEYANATYDNDHNPSTPEVAWPDVYKRYATSISRIDNEVGDIVKLLKDLKLDSNTMIVFTSDNGPSIESYLKEQITPDFFNSFGPFDGIKRDCWEGGVRMPTIATWPGHIPANRKVENPSISYDWMPTFAVMAGVVAPARTDGVSLLPSLTGSGMQRESQIYIEYMNNGKTPAFEEFDPKHRGRVRDQMQVVRIGDNVGVRYNIQSQNDDFEIYNVVTDPGQKKNLANSLNESAPVVNPGMDGLQAQMKKTALHSRRPNSSAPRPYDNELVPSASTDKNLQKGLSWQMYAASFPWVPDVSTLKPSNSGVSGKIEASLLPAKASGALFFDGFIKVPEDGEYTFYLNADRGALLRINDAIVADADYGYRGGEETSGKISLKAGLHAFRLYYVHKGGSAQQLNLQWDGPGIVKQKLSEGSLFHK